MFRFQTIYIYFKLHLSPILIYTLLLIGGRTIKSNLILIMILLTSYQPLFHMAKHELNDRPNKEVKVLNKELNE